MLPVLLTNFNELQVNHIRNKHHINVHGANPPDPIETFGQLVNEYSIPQQIVNNLITCGYKEPTPIQMQAIPIMSSVSICNDTMETMSFDSLQLKFHLINLEIMSCLFEIICRVNH